MNNLIVAVKSSFAELQAGAHDVIRATWGQALRGRAQVKFFLGRKSQEIAGAQRSLHPTWENSYSPKSDEAILEVPDDFNNLVWKTRGICQWAMDRRFDHLLIVNTRTIVYPKKLWTSNYPIADYAGTFNGVYGDVGPCEVGGTLVDDCYSWASGPYFLSRKATMVIADKTPIQARYVKGSADDFWVGQILGPLAAKGDLLSVPLDEAVAEQGNDLPWVEDQWQKYLHS